MARGGGGAGRGTLKGLSFDQRPEAGEAPLETQPSALFPTHPNLKKPRPLSQREEDDVRNFKSLRDAIHAGPMYTNSTKRVDATKKTFSQEQYNAQFAQDDKANFDPFNGVETYSKMKAPPKKTIPKISEMKLDKSLFPKELWPTLEGDEGDEAKIMIQNGREKMRGNMDAMEAAAKRAGKTKAELLLEKFDSLAKKNGLEEEEAAFRDRLDEIEAEEDMDEVYEDDEEGNDYNAEGYFDDGADDSDGGEGGGDDGF